MGILTEMGILTSQTARDLPLSIISLGGALCIAVFYLSYKLYTCALRPEGYPPGPPSVAVLGNLSHLPQKGLHLQFAAWTKQYGEIFSLNFGGMRVVLVNSKRMVREVFEKKSQVTSKRMDTYYREFTHNGNIINKDNDEDWRRSRRMYHLRLHTKKADSYLPYQEVESLQFLINILDAPDRYSDHLHLYTASLATTLFYGIRYTPSTGGLIADLLQWMVDATACQVPQLIDFYPFLRPLFRLVPTALSPFKRKVRDLIALENRFFVPLVEETKKNMEKGKIYPSFVRDCLTVDEKDRLSDYEIGAFAVHAAGAASDSQRSTALGCLSGLFHYPEALRAAQAELDAVIGNDRLPTWADRAALPVMRGIVEETLRWSPTGFTGIPHVLARDEVFDGHKVKKDTVLMLNTWALANDAPDPRRFDPLRFKPEDTLSEQLVVQADSMRRNHFAFGAGRRVCPGSNVAMRGLFTLLSRFIWAYNIGPKIGPDGEPIKVLQDDFDEGLSPRVKLWECSITPRDEHRVAFMRKAWEEAQRTSFDSDGQFSQSFMERIFELGNEKVST